jgi:hypothetical protein
MPRGVPGARGTRRARALARAARAVRVRRLRRPGACDATRQFLAEHRAPGPWLVKTGRDQEFIDGLDRRWSGALPVTIVYDPAGKPVQFWEGGADSARFATAVEPLLTNRP